jgi:type VI secretion system secreted protein Hcp
MDLFLLQLGEPDFLPPGMYPKIPGLPPTDEVFDPSLCVKLTAFSQDLKPQATAGPQAAVFTLVKPVDALSVRLYEYCMQGRPLGAGPNRPTYVHVLRDLGGPAPLAMTLSLRDPLVVGLQLQSGPDGAATETITLTVSEALWLYRLAADGGQGTLRAGWSVAQNKPIISFT